MTPPKRGIEILYFAVAKVQDSVNQAGTARGRAGQEGTGQLSRDGKEGHAGKQVHRDDRYHLY